jgi:hypothetical protein
MYQCNLIHDGQIGIRERLAEKTLNQAIAASHKLLNSRPLSEHFNGIEIWQGAALVYDFGEMASE